MFSQPQESVPDLVKEHGGVDHHVGVHRHLGQGVVVVVDMHLFRFRGEGIGIVGHDFRTEVVVVVHSLLNVFVMIWWNKWETEKVPAMLKAEKDLSIVHTLHSVARDPICIHYVPRRISRGP